MDTSRSIDPRRFERSVSQLKRVASRSTDARLALARFNDEAVLLASFPAQDNRAGDVLDAAAEGYRLNVAPRAVTGAAAIEPLLTVDDPAVVVEAVKLAEDQSGDVVVRLYEARGAKAWAVVTPGFAFESVAETDLLERDVDQTAIVDAEGALALSVRPFQLVTLRFRGVSALR